MRALGATMLAALVLPACALAHVTIAPPFVNDGIASKISFEAPNERAPHATIELRTSAPPGVRIVSAAAPPGWRVALSGSTVTWSGGRIEGTRTVAFPLRVLAKRPGRHVFLPLRPALRRRRDGEVEGKSQRPSRAGRRRPLGASVGGDCGGAGGRGRDRRKFGRRPRAAASHTSRSIAGRGATVAP